ncbi:MAG: polyketide cyclase [Hyphomicrobiales bacterium]|nr:MAG: polyketide cyclase [Hyphomicrobiales bacterium]
MTERSIAHGSFTVTRSYPASPARVFKAWSNPEYKRKWFGSPKADNPEDIFEFRVGGREYNAGKMGNDIFTFDVRYQDIVPDQRIVYTYEMTMNGDRISVSLATIEIEPEGTGSRMTVVEHGAFLDGLDTVRQREEGTNALIDALGKSLVD